MGKGKTTLFALALLAGAIISAPANAAQWTSWGTLESIQSGWVQDQMLVFHNAPMVNPGNQCTIRTNGYVINDTQPARKTYYDMLIAAKINFRQVAFVVDGCFGGRPRIVSVSLR